LQLQNISALGVGVNQKYIHALNASKLKQIWYLTWGWYNDKSINNYTRVKPENIIKLKHYMINGLSIYQTMYCKTTFLELPRLSYITFNRSAVGKTILLRQKPLQTHYYYRIATKFAKAYLH